MTAMTERRRAWTAAELMAAEFPEPKWVVPGILTEGLTFLVGPPKLGKSWLALGLCVSTASGGYALGRLPVERSDVLYLALEDTARRLQSRLAKVLGGEPVPSGLTFMTAWPRLDAEGGEWLRQWLTKNPDCGLVVVDVFAKVKPIGTGGSVYADDYGSANILKQIADEFGIAVLVLHHTRKAAADDYLDTVSGTNGLTGAADTTLILKRSRGSADAVLSVTGRDVEESEHALRFDPASGTWNLLDGEARDYELGDTARVILQHLRDSDTYLPPKRVADALGLDHELVKKTMRRMAERGDLLAHGGGRYGVSPVSPVSPGPVAEWGVGDTGATGDTLDGAWWR